MGRGWERPWDTNALVLGFPRSRTVAPETHPHLAAGAGGGRWLGDREGPQGVCPGEVRMCRAGRSPRSPRPTSLSPYLLPGP